MNPAPPAAAARPLRLRVDGAHLRGAARAGLVVSWAEHADEVRQAQRLRFDVFAREMGARLRTPLANHDIDRFDDYCEHLLVRDASTREVIGTYRLLAACYSRCGVHWPGSWFAMIWTP